MSAFREDILAGRVALVTGGATGIGKEIARTLGRHGASVCIASRKPENLAAAAECVDPRGVRRELVQEAAAMNVREVSESSQVRVASSE